MALPVKHATRSRLGQWPADTSAVVADLLARLASIIAPPRCLGCLQEGTWLCHRCQARLGAFPLSCIVCEKPQARGLTCAGCRAATPLEGVVSVGSYRTLALQRGIGWLKYQSIKALVPVLASLLLPRLLSIAPWEELQKKAVLVPIPLHRSRQRERGFNQSHEIARAMADSLGLPALSALSRQRATWTQSKLPKELRENNVQNAFALAAPLPPEQSLVILIDDVTTSGSTLAAAAHALRAAGDPVIWGATIARG